MGLRLKGQTTGYVELEAPASAADNTLTLPNGNGTNGQVLTTNGSGTLSFTTVGPFLDSSDIGSTVQAFDADTAKTDVAQTFTPAQTFTAQSVHNGGIDCNGNADVAGSFNIDGPYKQVAEAVSALDINLSTGNYFTKTINGNSTFTFSNPPSSGTVGSFTLELTHTSGTVTWPASVKFNADTAPTLTTGKTHLFFFVTDDGGTRYRGSALVDYVN